MHSIIRLFSKTIEQLASRQYLYKGYANILVLCRYKQFDFDNFNHFKVIGHTLVNFWICYINHFSMLIVNFKCCLVGRKKKKWRSPCSFSFHRASNMTCFFSFIMNYIRNVPETNSKYF